MPNWVLDRASGELIGPCGCRVRFSTEGIEWALNHKHKES